MSKRFSNEEKQKIVLEYKKGESVDSLCHQYKLPKSTLYYWIRQIYLLKSSTDNVVYYREFLELQRHVKKLEDRLSVIKAADCSLSAPLQEKLIALEKLYGKFNVRTLCDALDVSRGTFYNHIFRRKTVTVYDERREEIREQIKSIFDESKQRFGANKIAAVLSDRGTKTSHKYVAELMREMGLYSIGKMAKREYTKKQRMNKKQNILQPKFNVSEPNHFWVSDITCCRIMEIYYYVCVIIDLFSRKVIAHRVSLKNSTYLVTTTFKRAYEARNNPMNLTFHSDQGCQYTSNAFRKLLRINNIVQSFSGPGRPHDNAVAESFFSYLKKEELYRTNYKSEREFIESINKYIHFYNTERPHCTLAYKTPE